MTTVGDILNRSRRVLRGPRREAFNIVDTELLPGVDTIVVAFGDRGFPNPGDFVGLGSEIAYVTATNPTSKTVTVVRGIDGTGDPDPIPVGTIVEVGWRWPTADLIDYLADEVRSWGKDIFTVASVPASIGVSADQVDLPVVRFSRKLRARYKRDAVRRWVDVPHRQWRVETGLPTSQFASGNALFVTPGYTGSFIIEYAQDFDLTGVSDMTTDISAVGFGDRLVDAATYGVAWRAVAPEEGGRVDRTHQPEPRVADEVRAGAALQTASAYLAIRDRRLGEEKARLRDLYPWAIG